MSLSSIFSTTNGNASNTAFKVAELTGLALGAAFGAAVGPKTAAVGGIAGLYAGRAVSNFLYSLKPRW